MFMRQNSYANAAALGYTPSFNPSRSLSVDVPMVYPNKSLRASTYLTLALALTSAPVFAQQVEPTIEQRREAGMAYSRASALRAGGQHDQAASLFENADRLAPSVQALGNAIREHRAVANPQHDMRAATLALRLLARYGSDPRYAEFANQVILETSPQLVRVTVACDGCTVEADGSLQADTEFFLLPGAHTLTAHWNGQRAREHRMPNARAGTAENVTILPTPEASSIVPRNNTTTGVSTNTGATGLTSSTMNSGSSNSTTSSGSSSSGSSSGTAPANTTAHVDNERPGAINTHGGAVTDPEHPAGGATSATTGGSSSSSENGGQGFGDGLVQAPPPSRGGLHPAIFLTTLGLTLAAGGVLTWSALDTQAGVPAYQAAAAASADSQEAYNSAMMLLADGQSRELRTNVLIGVTSGLGAIAVGTLIFTRWNRAERPPAAQTVTARLIPGFGPLPNLTFCGTF